MAVDNSLLKKAGRNIEISKREEERILAIQAQLREELARQKEARAKRKNDVKELEKAAAAEYAKEMDRYFILLGKKLAADAGVMPAKSYKTAMEDKSVADGFYESGEFLGYFNALLKNNFPDIDCGEFAKKETQVEAPAEAKNIAVAGDKVEDEVVTDIPAVDDDKEDEKSTVDAVAVPMTAIVPESSEGVADTAASLEDDTDDMDIMALIGD